MNNLKNNMNFEYFNALNDEFQNLENINLSNFDKNNTVLIIVDMVNGFVKEGALSSKDILDINENISKIALNCNKKEIPIIAFSDSHCESCEEFNSFPVHCVKGTYESFITDEIKKAKFITIEKNSTNGFIEDEFLNYIKSNENIENFIVIGCCTDICVLQFSLTLKAYYNKNDKPSNVFVVKNLTQTYNASWHEKDFWNVVAYSMMKQQGIKIINDIEI